MDDVFIIPAEVGAVYLSFLGALTIVYARWSSKAVLTMAIIAAWGAWDVWDGNFQFMQLFFGSPRTLDDITRHTSADVRQLAFMLSLVCGVLVFVCLYENMDE